MTRLMVAAGSLSALLITGCATIPAPDTTPVTEPTSNASATPPNVAKLLRQMSGRYSNIAQVDEQKAADHPSPAPLMDLDGAVGEVDGRSVLVVRRDVRETNRTSWRLYEIASTNEADRFAITMAGASQEQMALPPAELLALTIDRVAPGCVIEATWSPGRLQGSNPDGSCGFEDPVEGFLPLSLSLDWTPEQFTLTEIRGQQNSTLRLDRVHAFEVVGYLRLSAPGQELTDAAWQQTQSFQLASNGKPQRLYNQAAEPLGFSVRLKPKTWRSEDDWNYRLDLINDATEALQGYVWAPLGSERIALERDWVNVRLTLIPRPASMQP